MILHDSLVHHHLSERQGPDIRPTLYRIAEAQRPVNNPSKGTARVVHVAFQEVSEEASGQIRFPTFRRYATKRRGIAVRGNLVPVVV